jgi:hypothetical protein
MKTLAVILIWLGVIVLLFDGSSMLPLIGFIATIAAGFWATARITADTSRAPN